MTDDREQVSRETLVNWHKLVASLDRLADLVGAEPGENPVPRAMVEIKRLRAAVEQARKTLGGAVL